MKNSVTFARSSVERHANIKINESQVFSMRDAFFVASRGQFISRVHVQLNINSLQNFGFSEHPRKLPKALTRVITEIDVPIGKTARSQYVDFHTSCESPHKNHNNKVNFPFGHIEIFNAQNYILIEIEKAAWIKLLYFQYLVRHGLTYSIQPYSQPFWFFSSVACISTF